MRLALMPFDLNDAVRWNVGLDLPHGVPTPEAFFARTNRREFPDIISFTATTPEQEWLCNEIMLKIIDRDTYAGFLWLPVNTVFDIEHVESTVAAVRLRVLIQNYLNVKSVRLGIGNILI